MSNNDEPTVMLAARLQSLYLETHDPAYLDRAIEVAREGSRATQDSAVHLSQLCNALRMRYELTGELSDLNGAIDAGTACLEKTCRGHRSEDQRLSNLGFALRLRYERLGTPDDIERAVELGRRAVESAQPGARGLSRLQSNLGVALRVHFEVSSDVQDLEDAVAWGEACLAQAVADSEVLPGMLANLGLAYIEWYAAAGGREPLERGIALMRRATEATPEGDPDRPMYALNLSVALRWLGEGEGDVRLLTSAIDAAEHAWRLLPPRHPERAACLSDLGRAQRLRASLCGDVAEARCAIGRRRQAASLVVAPPRTRALAAAAWGQWSCEDGDVREALRGYTVAVKLLPQVAWLGLPGRARVRHVKGWAGLAEDAGAVAVAAGRPDEALVLLEQGRTVFWNQILDMNRDLAALRSVDAGMYERMDGLRRLLDRGTRELHRAAP
jgi:hypothetical protein